MQEPHTHKQTLKSDHSKNFQLVTEQNFYCVTLKLIVPSNVVTASKPCKGLFFWGEKGIIIMNNVTEGQPNASRGGGQRCKEAFSVTPAQP